jgi:pimeloyl-ACP methyl ester carboxylesterase
VSRIEFRKLPLSTEVTLNVGLSGDPDAPAVILLHGFPESHRTWRELEPRLGGRLRLVMPDQRGFAGSDKPADVKAYKSEKLIDDSFALADALGLERFALVGHDWGGVLAWSAALRGDPRLTRLAIINAPHPVIFQKSLIANPAQRAASQYIKAFRTLGFAKLVEWRGFEWFFDKVFGSHVDLALIPAAERRQYIAQWSEPGAFAAMLNWYRASPVKVPLPGITWPLPRLAAEAVRQGANADAGGVGNARPGAATGAAGRPRCARRAAEGGAHRRGRALRAVGSAGCRCRGACPLP